MFTFRDRRDAGRRLAGALAPWGAREPVIIALPRGGVPVAFEVAWALRAPLDIRVVRKLALPEDPEVGIGAVAEGGDVYVSSEGAGGADIGTAALATLIEREQAEVAARVARFRTRCTRLPLRGRAVIVIDDGIATGGTALAALASIRREAPLQLVLAVPVAAADTLERLTEKADEIVCLLTPDVMFSVGEWYEEFQQVDDAEVVELLEHARRRTER